MSAGSKIGIVALVFSGGIGEHDVRSVELELEHDLRPQHWKEHACR
jgi:hypothetical protein